MAAALNENWKYPIGAKILVKIQSFKLVADRKYFLLKD